MARPGCSGTLKTQQCSQGLTYQVLGAIEEVLGLTLDAALEAAGEYFVGSYLLRKGYKEMLRSQGKDLREFLCNMDRMHAHLMEEELPGLAPPSFNAEDDKEEGYLLHSWSFRPGLGPMVQGMVCARAESFCNARVELLTLSTRVVAGGVWRGALCAVPRQEGIAKAARNSGIDGTNNCTSY